MQVNEYQATIIRRAWFRNKLETLHVIARNKTEALKDVTNRYPKRATITVKYVRTLEPNSLNF